MHRLPCYPSFWQAAVLCVVLLVAQMMGVAQLGIIGSIASERLGTQRLDLAGSPLGLAIVNLAAFGLVLTWGAARARAPLREVFPLGPIPWRLVGPISLAVTGAAILSSEVDNLVRRVLPMPEAVRRAFMELHENPWSGGVLLMIVAPVTEEPLFRGLILRGFLSRYRPTTAILASAALFGLAHGSPWQLFSAAGTGAMFGWWMFQTRSLWPGLLGHALLNSTPLVGAHLPVEIRGFNRGDPLTLTELQPLWFDAMGLGLTTAGVLLFALWKPRSAGEALGPESLPSGSGG